MANFPRVHPAGWGVNDPLSSADINQLDIDHTKAPNFDDGSAHTPADDIEITGPSGPKLMGVLKLKYATRSITRMLPLAGAVLDANHSFQSGEQQITENILGGVVIIPLDLPHGQVLDSVTLSLNAANGHANDPITATPIGITVEKQAKYDTAPTPLATILRDTTDRTTYEGNHDLTKGSLAHTIDRATYRYTLRIDGENGGDAVAGCNFLAVLVTCEISDQSEWNGG